MEFFWGISQRKNSGVGVLGTPLKLVTTKRLKVNKSYNFNIISTTKNLVNQLIRWQFFRGQFYGLYFSGGQFSEGQSTGGNFPAGFLPVASFRTPFVPWINICWNAWVINRLIKYDYYAESILIKFDDVLDYSPLRGFILPIRPMEMKKILGGDYQLWNIVSHYGWPTKKIFHFNSSKRAR